MSAEYAQFVSFYIEEDLYGIDILLVKEISPVRSVFSVPLAQPEIRGLMNIRGQVVLVMDLAVMFGRPPRPIHRESQLVIFKTSGEFHNTTITHDRKNVTLCDKKTGVIVDRISDVRSCENRQIETVPPHLPHDTAHYFEGVLRVGDELQMILDVGEILA
jgi:purine-binding chemotaxis protein CheW